ncbi:hypothetical protein F5Y14DRAFT_363061 [Nemania sp. NC0429]|nr:hypothetical protein F5Y14DRAFT_363061 [Nemania sp. NC0429]
MARQGQTTKILDLIQDAKHTNFDNEESLKKFWSKHEMRLSKRNNKREKRDGILHGIAKERKAFAESQKFVKWIVKAYPYHLEVLGEGGFTPLHCALRSKNHSFVELVLSNAENAGELLCEQTDLSETCLHLAIGEKSPLTEWIIETAKAAIATSSNPFTIQSTDKDKDYSEMTPLHIAVTPPPRNGGDSDDELWDSDDDDDETENEVEGKWSHNQANTAFDRRASIKSGSNSSVPPQGRERDTREEFSMNLLQRVNSIKPPSQATIRNGLPIGEADVPVRRREFNIINVVKGLVDAYGRALVDCRDAKNRTPFQARLSRMEENNDHLSAVDREESRRNIFKEDEILRYMREYIIDNFSRQEALRALYTIGNERILEFDLSGLPRQQINTGYLEGLAKVLRFEGILKYVALPQLAFEADEESRHVESSASSTKTNKGKGLHHMCPIFKWLKACNVEGILEVTVVDHGDVSHSDEAIEICVDQLDVRVWNWYKVDLSCDVIIKKAPRAREVNLYSSGNNAVLMGWSSEDGLARLTELHRVRVFVQEGLENGNRVTDNMEAFKNKLKQRRPLLDVDWQFHEPDPNRNSVFAARGTPREIESKWMETMKKFANFLARVPPNIAGDPVKIAIIDDGIDTSLDNFTDRIQVGESFCRLGELSGSHRNSYYVPSGPHGTVMAQLICRICPVVKLYIAQLEVLPGQHGQRSFTTESAIEALQWAVTQEVDIISMSWSIRGRSGITDLANAIKAADAKRILMFCASPDDGTTTDNTYPAKEPSCIKIGACTATGAILSWVSDQSAEYLLPGEAPGLETDPGAEPSSWNNYGHIGSFGSSVSTALAAGLAGVILFCDRLMRPKSDEDSTTKHGEGPTTEIFRDVSKMKTAFTRLSETSHTKRFPWLPIHDPESLCWNEQARPDETAKTKKELSKFVERLKA